MLTRAACNKLPLSACAPSTTGSRTASAPWTSNIPSAPRLADAVTARNGLTCGGSGSMRGGCSKSRKVNCLIQPHEMRAARNSHRKRGGCRRLSTRFCWATPSTRRQCYGQTGDAPDPKRFKRSQPCASPPGRYSARWLLLDFPVGRPRTARGCEQRCSSQGGRAAAPATRLRKRFRSRRPIADAPALSLARHPSASHSPYLASPVTTPLKILAFPSSKSADRALSACSIFSIAPISALIFVA